MWPIDTNAVLPRRPGLAFTAGRWAAPPRSARTHCGMGHCGTGHCGIRQCGTGHGGPGAFCSRLSLWRCYWCWRARRRRPPRQGPRPSTCTGTLGGLLVSGGSGQAARAGTAFADPLAAEVVDTGGCPLSNVDVEFVAPTSGAGATFPGSATTATVATGTDGVATAPR